jgi:hypothetical protein
LPDGAFHPQYWLQVRIFPVAELARVWDFEENAKEVWRLPLHPGTNVTHPDVEFCHGARYSGRAIRLEQLLSVAEATMSRFAGLTFLVVIFSLPALIIPASAQPRAAKEEKKAAAVKGRLPAHFAKIVDDGQRARIYRIQAEYQAKIEPLQAELEALLAKRDAEIRNILRPEQLRQLDTRVSEAQAARAAKAAKKGDAKKAEVAPVKQAGVKKAG